MKEEINHILKDEIIKKSKSLQISPILILKKDGSIRFCVDYKRSNTIIIEDIYLLLVVNNTIDKIRRKKYYTFMNLASEYWQIEVNENSQNIIAFIIL